MDTLANEILILEKELLKSEVRQSSEKISEILDNDFFEFCSSGDVYKYTSGDVFEALEGYCEIKDFAIKVLSNDNILATYRVLKYNLKDEVSTRTLRSSIWKRGDSDWKIIFHQGTLVKSSDDS